MEGDKEEGMTRVGSSEDKNKKGFSLRHPFLFRKQQKMTRTAQVDKLLKLFYKYLKPFWKGLPTGIASDIAREVGCSRELVRQRAERLKMATAYKKEHVPVPIGNCRNCGKVLTLDKYHRNTKYCSPKCCKEDMMKKYWVEFTCEVCGITKRVRCGNTRKRRFCSKYCQGVWLGTNYGRSRKRSIPFDISKKKFGNKPFTAKDISDLLDVEVIGAYNNILKWRQRGWVTVLVKGKSNHPAVYQITKKSPEIEGEKK